MKKTIIRNIAIVGTRFCLAAILSFLCAGVGWCQVNKVDVQKLTQETQKVVQEANKVGMVWWVPEEFWQASLSSAPQTSEEQVEDFLRVLRPYTVVAVVDGELGIFGGATYKSEDVLRDSLQLIESEGTSYRPLSAEKIEADTNNLLSIMKPLIGNMLGPFGQNMHFFLFPSENKNGRKIVDAKREGAFSIKLDTSEYKWRLPLGSLMPPKRCPVDGELMDGSWTFCPWHGEKLDLKH